MKNPNNCNFSLLASRISVKFVFSAMPLILLLWFYCCRLSLLYSSSFCINQSHKWHAVINILYLDSKMAELHVLGKITVWFFFFWQVKYTVNLCKFCKLFVHSLVNDKLIHIPLDRFCVWIDSHTIAFAELFHNCGISMKLFLLTKTRIARFHFMIFEDKFDVFITEEIFI